MCSSPLQPSRANSCHPSTRLSIALKQPCLNGYPVLWHLLVNDTCPSVWGSHMGMWKSELNGILRESESRVPKSFLPYFLRYLAGTDVSQGWVDSSPRTISALLLGGLRSCSGRETPPWSPVTPHHQYRGQQGRREARPREASEKVSTSRTSCVDGALEVWVGKGGSCTGSRAGGAQVLLSTSCLLLLWHLSLPFPT